MSATFAESRDRSAHRAGRPIEWLFSVLSDREGHRRLLEECGSMAVAAYRLALARCRTSEVPTEVPSSHELRGAAREIARRTGQVHVPSTLDLVRECEAAGLLVI